MEQQHEAQTSDPIYRTKLMVIGHENVGKTSILDCLFPIQDIGETKGLIQKTEYLIELQGKYLRKYKPKELNKDYKEIILEERQWNVQKIKETGLELIPLNDKNQKKIEIYFKNQETRDKWIERLKRVTLNAATHGIEVNTHIWNSSTFNQHQNKNLEAKQNGNRNRNENEEKKDEDDYVEYSTWDFAGQTDYYNTHHYFLSNRSIILVLYRMDKGINGLESLDFWFKSLSSHLNQNYCDENGKPFYSIIIIGTFLDSIIGNQNEDKNLRQTKIMEIYDRNGLKSPPFYFEVSCSTLENIDELREIIFNVSLSHSYMGENVPVGYLTIEKSIYELRKLKQDHPVIEIQDLINHVKSQSQVSFEFDIEFVKRGLKLLHEWGICIYFDKPIELSNIVVLDPQHFTKNILGDLFRADESIRKLRVNGIIEYSQLNRIWNGPTNLIDTYLSLLEKFEVCFILENRQNESENQNQKKLVIPNLLSEDKTGIIEERLREKWTITIPRGEIEIERIFSFNQVPSEMGIRFLVRFHDKIVDNIIWRRGVLLKHFDDQNENKNGNILCLLEVKMEENLFEIRIRGKERNKCLEMMKYIYEEVKIVSGHYGGVKWKECVRSPHFSKGLINLNDILEDCKLDLTDRKLVCPITHFPIYGEDLLFKTGLLDTLDIQDDFGNEYWNYIYENQESQKSETKPIFEDSQKLNEKEYEKVEYLLNLFGFDISKVDKVIGSENKILKRSFEARGQQIYGQHKDTPYLFKREDWIDKSEPELRTSIIQYLGDYISTFRKIGWNHGNNSFVIPIIQGTTEDAAWRICDNGFGTICKIDAGCYAQGVYITSKAEYAAKYCFQTPKVFVIGFVIVGNPFPVIEHPFQDYSGKPMKNENGYLGKPISPGYQSHFTLVDGHNISTAYPITKVEQSNQKWIADELIVHESQIYPTYIVYYNTNEFDGHSNKYSRTPIWKSCENGNIEIVKLFLNDKRVGVNHTNDSETPFYIACSNGHNEVVRLLLNDERVDTNKANKKGETPFYIACEKGHIEIVKLLLNGKRVDTNKANKNNETPFYIACQNGRIGLVELLLSDERVDINKGDKNETTPFYIVCYYGHIDIVKLLLNDLRVDKTQTENDYWASFWMACYDGHLDLVKLLLNDKKIDINNPNKYGQTPFFIACQNGHTEIMKLLLNDNRIGLNKANKDGQTPFWIACYNGQIEIVQLLLNDQRVDINKASDSGQTPFYIACAKGHIDIVKLLLNDDRISIRKEASEGKTAIDIAKKENHSNIVKLIQEFDTEKRYRDYLETFQSTYFFRIENEMIKEQDFPTLIEYLKKNNNIKELRFQNCGLTPPILLKILKTLLSKCEDGELSNMQKIELDENIQLESTKGLEIIPIEIRNQGSKSIGQYILDLCRSSNPNSGLNSNTKPISTSKPLYRTKLMVVGYENVGKTTILDCLFPMEDIGKTKRMFQTTEYLIELQGKYLRKYKSKESNKDYKEIILENREWNVQEIEETGLELIPLNDKTQKKIEIYFKNQETRDKWSERLKRITFNVATHGIEIQDQILQNSNKLNNVTPNIDVSIWDFAGQHDYYNTHHYFLSTRTVFLVLWKMKDEKNGKNGLEGLKFWFKSLSSHLKYDLTLTDGKPYFSIMVVGTFLDDEKVDKSKESKELREQEILEIAKSNGIHYSIEIYEVSCSTLENIDELKQDIYKIALTHGYMGEKLPIGYLTIKNSIEKLKRNYNEKDIPIISLQELIDDCKTNSTFEFDEDFVKRGLNLLHMWGTCVYFDEPIELSNDVVLKPEFLSQEIMGQLFKPNLRHNIKDGILNHSDLKIFWPNYMGHAENLMLSMEKFEICFRLKENELKEFKDQRSLITSYLPEDKHNDLSKYWPTIIPRKEIEIERIFSFNQVPSEMVSRLLVRFQNKIVDNIIWRRGVLLKHFDDQNENKNGNILCLLEVKMEENLFEIRIRGKDRNECLEMMKYIYEEVKIVSGHYGGVKWKECVRSPHFSKGLIGLNDILEDCKLEIKDRQLICPITHFPIYGEDLLFKTGLLNTLANQNNIGNEYWDYTYENQNQNQNQQSEPEPIFENSKILNPKGYEKVEYLLNLFGFDISKVDKVIGSENKNRKISFDTLCQQIYGQHKDTPNLFKRENWIEKSESKVRKSMVQYLGDYISTFRQVGWNHGNNTFVIPMIQGTTKDAAWRICDNGFGTASTLDAGYYSKGVYVTSKAEYAEKYCPKDHKVFVIGFVLVGNPFPVIEHPYMTDKEGNIIFQEDKPKKNENGYLGAAINPGYQSHFTLVDGRSISTAFPITDAEQLKQEWIADELVVHESQIYPSYIVYYK